MKRALIEIRSDTCALLCFTNNSKMGTLAKTSTSEKRAREKARAVSRAVYLRELRSAAHRCFPSIFGSGCFGFLANTNADRNPPASTTSRKRSLMP
jgi:hypothetical protein